MRLRSEGGGDTQETAPQLQGEDVKWELDVQPSWDKTGQLVIPEDLAGESPSPSFSSTLKQTCQPAAWVLIECCVSSTTPASPPSYNRRNKTSKVPCNSSVRHYKVRGHSTHTFFHPLKQRKGRSSSRAGLASSTNGTLQTDKEQLLSIH